MSDKEKLPYLTEEEQKRFKAILGEIQDVVNAMYSEVSGQRAYRSYLDEKLRVLYVDTNVLKGINETKEEE